MFLKNNYRKEHTHGGDPAGHENDSKSNGLLNNNWM